MSHNFHLISWLLSYFIDRKSKTKLHGPFGCYSFWCCYFREPSEKIQCNKYMGRLNEEGPKQKGKKCISQMAVIIVLWMRKANVWYGIAVSLAVKVVILARILGLQEATTENKNSGNFLFIWTSNSIQFNYT